MHIKILFLFRKLNNEESTSKPSNFTEANKKQ